MVKTPANRILIVEDDAHVLGLMTRHFRRIGFDVDNASTAEEVLARFEDTDTSYDVVLTDVHLPGASGLDLARRFHEVNPEQEIVFMTGDADAANARRALSEGAAGYLLKPFEFFELDAVVNHALKRRAVIRPVGAGAHVTVPARVVLSPRHSRRSRVMNNMRAAIATAAFVALAWLAGSAIAPAPVQPAAQPVTNESSDDRPLVIPVVIERSVYLK